jgi:hypothetical protein
MAHRDHLVLKVLKALTEHKVCKVHKEHWVAKALTVLKVQLVQELKAPKASKEFKELLVRREHLAHKEQVDQPLLQQVTHRRL